MSANILISSSKSEINSTSTLLVSISSNSVISSVRLKFKNIRIYHECEGGIDKAVPL